MSPLWEIEYSDEVKFYFIDNGDLLGNLLGEIERLRYFEDGLPEGNYLEVEPGHIEWFILDHWVYYWKEGKTLVISVVKPL
jgi:hypothetical protein